MDPELSVLINDIGDSVSVMTDAVSGYNSTSNTNNEDSVAVVATTTTAISSIISNKTMSFS
jgi:hypothetical protein